MSENNRQDKKYTASELSIVQRDEFPVLDDNPIDALDGAVYSRLEKLASWFVLRAPLTEVTKLANPGSITLFKTDKDPKKGSRALNRAQFDEAFLSACGLDCTQFEFVYTRTMVKPQMISLHLATNSGDVFQSPIERAVCFVGKNSDSSGEDSCIESICRHVRNAFAHGRIAIRKINDEPFIFLEDGTSPDKVDYEGNKPSGSKIEVRFRMLVRIATLETWHGILLHGKNPAECGENQ